MGAPGRDLAQAHRDLAWLIGAAQHLLDARHKGTPRYWLGSSSRAKHRGQVRTVDPDVSVHGKPAPLNLDAFDQLTDLTTWALTTAPQLGRDYRIVVREGWPDPRPALTHIRTHLTPRTPTDLATRIAADAHQHAHRVAILLGLITDGQVLDADCPHCHHHKCLRVFDTADGPLIACLSPACRVESTDRSGRYHWHGHAAWRYPQGWISLAKMLDDAT